MPRLLLPFWVVTISLAWLLQLVAPAWSMSPGTIQQYNDLVNLYNQQQYHQVLETNEKGLDWTQDLEPALRLSVLRMSAYSAYRMNHLEEANRYFWQAYQASKISQGEHHPETLSLLTKYALSAEQTNQLSPHELLSTYDTLLIELETYSPEDPGLPAVRQNLMRHSAQIAFTCLKHQELESALPWLLKAYQLNLNSSPTQEMLRTRAGLAESLSETYFLLGQKEEAQHYHQVAKSLYDTPGLGLEGKNQQRFAQRGENIAQVTTGQNYAINI